MAPSSNSSPSTLNGSELPALTDRSLSEVAISTYLHPTRVDDLPLRDGRLGVWLHADTPSWDWLPGAAVVSGAGGVIDVFHHGGHRWHVAGPPTGVAQARAAVPGTTRER